MYVHTGALYECDTDGQMGQLRLMCHFQLRRRGAGVVVWSSQGNSQVGNSQVGGKEQIFGEHTSCRATQKQWDTKGSVPDFARLLPVCHTEFLVEFILLR